MWYFSLLITIGVEGIKDMLPFLDYGNGKKKLNRISLGGDYLSLKQQWTSFMDPVASVERDESLESESEPLERANMSGSRISLTG
jgi:hypothetical protein